MQNHFHRRANIMPLPATLDQPPAASRASNRGQHRSRFARSGIRENSALARKGSEQKFAKSAKKETKNDWFRIFSSPSPRLPASP
jgi:hypothetical protein